MGVSLPAGNYVILSNGATYLNDDNSSFSGQAEADCSLLAEDAANPNPVKVGAWGTYNNNGNGTAFVVNSAATVAGTQPEILLQCNTNSSTSASVSVNMVAVQVGSITIE